MWSSVVSPTLHDPGKSWAVVGTHLGNVHKIVSLETRGPTPGCSLDGTKYRIESRLNPWAWYTADQGAQDCWVGMYPGIYKKRVPHCPGQYLLPGAVLCMSQSAKLKGNDMLLLFAILFLWLNLENHLHSQNVLIASEYKIIMILKKLFHYLYTNRHFETSHAELWVIWR